MSLTQSNGWDFHCHLDLFSDPPTAFQACEQDRLFTFSMTTTPQAWKQNMLWAKGNDFVRVGLGLHPELVAERRDEAKLLISLIPQVRFVGEIGIDGSPQYRTSYYHQCQIFEDVVRECNRLGNKVMSIHSRRAVKPVLDIIQLFKKRSDIIYILHWFSGSKAQALKAVELGCYFSINESMLQNERNLKILTVIPLNRILTETDEPFRTEGHINRINQFNRCVLGLSALLKYDERIIRDSLNHNSTQILCN